MCDCKSDQNQWKEIVTRNGETETNKVAKGKNVRTKNMKNIILLRGKEQII